MTASVEELFAKKDRELFSQAAAIAAEKEKYYWSPAVLSGECRTSPHCRHCKWESFKSSRPGFGRTRSEAEILRGAEAALNAGATHLLAPSGWMGPEVPDAFCERIRALKERFGAEVYGLCGAVSRSSLRRLRDAGMDGYQCGLESPDETIYRSFRPGGDSLSDRIRTLKEAKSLGLKTWSGFLLAFGLSDEAALEGLKTLRDLSVDWVAVQPFVPYPDTDFQAADPTNPYRWARLMAVARLYFDPGVQLVASENSGAYANFMSLTGANAFFIFPNQIKPGGRSREETDFSRVATPLRACTSHRI